MMQGTGEVPSRVGPPPDFIESKHNRFVKANKNRANIPKVLCGKIFDLNMMDPTTPIQ